MSKTDLLQRIVAQLEADYAVMTAAAREAKENATGDETKSDGKYDTRAVEASYLAGAQAEQAEQLAEAIHLFKVFDPPSYSPSDRIGLGAVVEAEQDGEISYYLLGPAGGGVTIEHEGFDLTVLTPDSRLYQHLLGAGSGDLLENPSLMIMSLT